MTSGNPFVEVVSLHMKGLVEKKERINRSLSEIQAYLESPQAPHPQEITFKVLDHLALLDKVAKDFETLDGYYSQIPNLRESIKENQAKSKEGLRKSRQEFEEIVALHFS